VRVASTATQTHNSGVGVLDNTTTVENVPSMTTAQSATTKTTSTTTRGKRKRRFEKQQQQTSSWRSFAVVVVCSVSSSLARGTKNEFAFLFVGENGTDF